MVGVAVAASTATISVAPVVLRVTAATDDVLTPEVTKVAGPPPAEDVEAVVFAQTQGTADVWSKVVVKLALARVRLPVALPMADHRTEPEGGTAELTYAVVATLVELSPADWVVAVVPFGSAVIDTRLLLASVATSSLTVNPCRLIAVNFKLPVKSPAVPLPIATLAAPRREIPVSFVPTTAPSQGMTCVSVRSPVRLAHLADNETKSLTSNLKFCVSPRWIGIWSDACAGDPKGRLPIVLDVKASFLQKGFG